MDKITNNSLAFIALCNEFCAELETVDKSTKEDITKSMLRILPRLYIMATDLDCESNEEGYIEDSLDEEKYNAIRTSLEGVFGEDDTYLEVFEEDMKYSDTPIADTVSEGLADLFQVFYNFVETVKNAPIDLINMTLSSIKSDFEQYWSRKLCNLMRPLNNIRYMSDERFDN